MKKKNIWIALILALCVCAASALLLLSQKRQMPDAEEDCAIIYVGKEEYMRVPLSQPRTVTVRQAGGGVNVIRVDENGIQMLEANCSNQHCVLTGQVTPDNWEWKPDGAFIICLPNQVSVELVVTE